MSTLEEVTKIVSKTTPTGEVDFEPMDQDVAQRLNGTTVTDAEGNQVKLKDTGRTVNESEENTITLDEGDTLNLGKDLKEVVSDTLRSHGDAVDYMRVTVNRAQKYITVYVNYEKSPDNPGESTEDAFRFVFDEGQVKLNSDGQTYDICPLTQQSGTVAIQKDIAKDNLMNFLKEKTNIAENEKEENENDDLLLGFKQVVEEYKANKNKETVKNLLRKARDFEGNTIQEKLQNAIKQYKECFLGEVSADLAARAAQKAYEKGREWQSDHFAHAAKRKATSNEDLKQYVKAYGVANITVIDAGPLGDLWYSIDDDGVVTIQDKNNGKRWDEHVPISNNKRFDGPYAKQLARLVAKWYDRYGSINREEGSDWHNWVSL